MQQLDLRASTQKITILGAPTGDQHHLSHPLLAIHLAVADLHAQNCCMKLLGGSEIVDRDAHVVDADDFEYCGQVGYEVLVRVSHEVQSARLGR